LHAFGTFIRDCEIDRLGTAPLLLRLGALVHDLLLLGHSGISYCTTFCEKEVILLVDGERKRSKSSKHHHKMAIHSRIPRLIAVVASIAIATMTLYSQVVSAGYMYCTYDAHIEPTIGEIVQTVLPSVDIDMEKHLNSMYETLAQSSTGPGSKNKKKGTKKQTSKDQGADREGKLSSMHEQLVSAGAHGVQRVSALPVPIRSLFSTGLYTIDLRSNDYVSFNDVYLLQQNYWSLSVICTASWIPSVVKNAMCICVEGEDINSSRLTNRERQAVVSTLVDANAGITHTEDERMAAGHWCVSSAPVCTSRNMNDYCRVFVDPIRPSCIYIRHEQTNILHHEGQLVTFNLSSYTVGEYVDKWTQSSLSAHLTDTLKQQLNKNDDSAFRTKLSDKYVKLMNKIQTSKHAGVIRRSAMQTLSFVLYAFANIPVNVAIGALGFSILYVAEDLASSTSFQYTLTALAGVTLFVLVTAYALYTMTLRTAKNSIPYAHIMLTPLFASLAVVPFTTEVFRNAVYYTALNFW
jgi:hypothetical protein